MTRKHVLALIATIALAGVVALTAQRRMVILKSGQRLTGDVTETSEGYEIRMHGGTIVVAKDQVLRVEDVLTKRDELKKRMAEVDPRDAEGHYQVALWAIKNKLPGEARDILMETLKLKPGHENAALQLRLVEIRLAEAARATTPAATTRVAPDVLDSSKFLKKEDIYRIRLLELGLRDRVVIDFRKDALKRFTRSMRGRDIFRTPGGEVEFRRYTNAGKARYIIDNTDRDNPILDDILVKSDPAVIKEFKTRVWPIVAKRCAAPSCHGGAKVRGGLKLFNVPLTDDRIVYTNFYILHKTERQGQKLIDRGGNREMSLLLQYGLPGRQAQRRHPGRIEPSFASRNDPGYRIIDKWIGTLRWPFLPPGYRIDYRLPGAGSGKEQPPTTRPSEPTAPTTRPYFE